MLYGSLGLIILKTLEALGPLHGYRIARRIEQISGDHLALNQGTLYPALLKLEQAGWIRSAWGESDSGRKGQDLHAHQRRPETPRRRKRRPGSTRPASSRGSSRFRTNNRDRPALHVLLHGGSGPTVRRPHARPCARLRHRRHPDAGDWNSGNTTIVSGVNALLYTLCPPGRSKSPRSCPAAAVASGASSSTRTSGTALSDTLTVHDSHTSMA